MPARRCHSRECLLLYNFRMGHFRMGHHTPKTVSVSALGCCQKARTELRVAGESCKTHGAGTRPRAQPSPVNIHAQRSLITLPIQGFPRRNWDNRPGAVLITGRRRKTANSVPGSGVATQYSSRVSGCCTEELGLREFLPYSARFRPAAPAADTA
jgi:hypothetical protein